MKNIGSVHITNDILANEEFHIKKRFGQNFLVDKNILDKIIKEAHISEQTDVIEIGPGFGALTEGLVSQARRVLAYEIDRDLIPILEKNFSDVHNLILVNQDILACDIDADIERYLPGSTETIVVANLPYYITTPILMRFLEDSKQVSSLFLMMQAEVADRVTSAPNTKAYGALSVVINYRAITKVLFSIPRSVFIPRPNVDSAVVMFTIRKEIEKRPTDEKKFLMFVHQCFSQRRKTLLNNLRQAFPNQTREALENHLIKCNLAVNIRAESLTTAAFIMLWQNLVSNNIKD
ncbi:MAG: 16S rRNA (adenine(1518)-N(6)/adenine(1519)-N(6))-dimethyltransferase RsmA [Candidatus Izemoplasmatales bacterium]|jgi:16S rRNA (adenine1518-N6/adenine1519-N6)-dimethyltransferase|nr:16S rRNA (adenine(1518)-N(6)/adenine(1519)-N(6))-dimethyltransferase RsmA [Candidatus Izemoplasmatales bacterium]